MVQRVTLDEQEIREAFIRYHAELEERAIKSSQRELKIKQKRHGELSHLMQAAYEDKVRGKIPEDICVGFIEKYSAEQKSLAAEIEELERKLGETETVRQNADDFIRDIKKYLDVPTLTREMCYELIDRVLVGGVPRITGKERTIEIVYKIDIASVLRDRFKK